MSTPQDTRDKPAEAAAPEETKPTAPEKAPPAEENKPAEGRTEAAAPPAKKPLTAAEKRKRRRRRRWKAFRSFLFRTLALFLVVYVLVFHIVGITTMPNGDMYPRIDSGDLVLFYRLEDTFKYQNVVVIDKAVNEDGPVILENPPEKTWYRKALDFLGFKDPDMPETTRFVCRIVAVPGDTVDFPEGERLTVNGNALVESNIFYTTQVYQGFENYPITLGEGEYFVMADYRRGGVDSRFFGPVKTEEIRGPVITIMRRNNI